MYTVNHYLTRESYRASLRHRLIHCDACTNLFSGKFRPVTIAAEAARYPGSEI
jgi:hypothetical protein